MSMRIEIEETIGLRQIYFRYFLWFFISCTFVNLLENY